ncbi:MAG: hypothetical protein HQL23_07275 [Candidatus Omnitrophica bacterium]|nr:hypothetical protein [Candidatus Omnitrophota bacterium]
MLRINKIISILLCLCLFLEQSGFAQMAGSLDIPGAMAAFRNSLIQEPFRPLHMRSLNYDMTGNNFRLLLDKGDAKALPSSAIESTAKILFNYFVVGIALPNSAFWVNLKPDAPDRILDDRLAKTDMGKVLLEADLQLKKDTAKFTSPDMPEGKAYWEKLYKKAAALYGTEDVAIPTMVRPWIVPAEIIMREQRTEDEGRNTESRIPSGAYIYKATLKVMLEQDYLNNTDAYNFKDPRGKALNEYAAKLAREMIIPMLTQEVNTAPRYAALRQVYYSLIMAQWFKSRFKNKPGVYSAMIDKENLAGLTSKKSWSPQTYFKAYNKSFKEGEYNIDRDVGTDSEPLVRNYISGGIVLNMPFPTAGASPAIIGDTKIAVLPGTSAGSPYSQNNILVSMENNIIKAASPASTDNARQGRALTYEEVREIISAHIRGASDKKIKQFYELWKKAESNAGFGHSRPADLRIAKIYKFYQIRQGIQMLSILSFLLWDIVGLVALFFSVPATSPECSLPFGLMGVFIVGLFIGAFNLDFLYAQNITRDFIIEDLKINEVLDYELSHLSLGIQQSENYGFPLSSTLQGIGGQSIDGLPKDEFISGLPYDLPGQIQELYAQQKSRWFNVFGKRKKERINRLLTMMSALALAPGRPVESKYLGFRTICVLESIAAAGDERDKKDIEDILDVAYQELQIRLPQENAVGQTHLSYFEKALQITLTDLLAEPDSEFVRSEIATIREEAAKRGMDDAGITRLVPNYQARRGTLSNQPAMPTTGNYPDLMADLSREQPQQVPQRERPRASSPATVASIISPAQSEDKNGGVDFRALPVPALPVMPAGNVAPVRIGDFSRLDIRNEWSHMQSMVNDGVVPSDERLRNYLLAACQQKVIGRDMDQILGLLADVMRLEESHVTLTDPGVENMLALIESNQPNREIQSGLSRISIPERELQLSIP